MYDLRKESLGLPLLPRRQTWEGISCTTSSGKMSPDLDSNEEDLGHGALVTKASPAIPGGALGGGEDTGSH